MVASASESVSNPFVTPDGADNWIKTVEGYDEGRELLIYPRVSEWAGTLAAGSVLVDVGCGQGKCSTLMPESIDYVGLDPSRPLVERAQWLYGGTNNHFMVGDAEAISLKDASVDAAMSIHVWFHLADLVQPSQELARILKPGGKLFITTANPRGYGIWESWYSNSVEDGKLLRGTLNNGEFEIQDSTFYRHSFDEITHALTTAGFSAPVIDEFGRYSQPTGMSLSATRP
jgi:ubiquinone/menaquinone biosynthesis C-methylase UbiE